MQDLFIETHFDKPKSNEYSIWVNDPAIHDDDPSSGAWYFVTDTCPLKATMKAVVHHYVVKVCKGVTPDEVYADLVALDNYLSGFSGYVRAYDSWLPPEECSLTPADINDDKLCLLYDGNFADVRDMLSSELS